MIPPVGFLRVFGACLDIESVIWRSGLLLGAGEHGENGETHGLHGERRRPVVRQDGEADVAVAVDVLVDRDRVRGPHEGHLGRVEGVLA